MSETCSFEDFKREQKKREIQTWLHNKAIKAKVWYANNKEIVDKIAPVIVVSGLAMGKSMLKHRNLSKQEHIKEEYVYDNRLGHYWALKRKLSNREWLEVDRRKRDGEPLADILESMRVLK